MMALETTATATELEPGNHTVMAQHWVCDSDYIPTVVQYSDRLYQLYFFISHHFYAITIIFVPSNSF